MVLAIAALTFVSIDFYGRSGRETGPFSLLERGVGQRAGGV